MGTRDWVRAQDPRARSALGSVLSDPLGGCARAIASGGQRGNSLPEHLAAVDRRPRTSRGFAEEQLQLDKLKSTAADILKIPVATRARSSGPGDESLAPAEKATRPAQPSLEHQQLQLHHSSRQRLPRIAEEQTEEHRLERVPHITFRAPLTADRLETVDERAVPSVELAAAETARCSSRLKPRSASVATQTETETQT